LALLVPLNKRKVIGTLALAGAGTYIALQYSRTHRQKTFPRRKSSSNAPGPSSVSSKRLPKRPSGGHALKEILPLLLRVAGRKIFVIAVLAILRTALSNRLARLQGYLFRAAFLRRVPLFARNLVENVALCAVAAGMEATSRSWVSFIELQWRRLLTKRLHDSYFDAMVILYSFYSSPRGFIKIPDKIRLKK